MGGHGLLYVISKHCDQIYQIQVLVLPSLPIPASQQVLQLLQLLLLDVCCDEREAAVSINYCIHMYGFTNRCGLGECV